MTFTEKTIDEMFASGTARASVFLPEAEVILVSSAKFILQSALAKQKEEILKAVASIEVVLPRIIAPDREIAWLQGANHHIDEVREAIEKV